MTSRPIHVGAGHRPSIHLLVRVPAKAAADAALTDADVLDRMSERVGIWFNKSKGTYGTLWADRFKSQLVQDGGNALRTVAAYIDLNGVRAGLAMDSKDYRFCGYAEALAGNEALQQQFARIKWAAASKPGEKADLKAAMADYRLWLMDEGAALNPGSGKKTKGVSEEVREEAS